jgi:hypothetical protein
MSGTLDELAARRAYECRLTPDRALNTLADAAAFLRDRGLLTRTPDCALPSLFGACHEDPYRSAGRGFASWPATKWPWGHELGALADVYELAIHRGKTIYLTDETLALVDPVCRAELARMERADPGWRRLLRHLAETGPSFADDVELELGLKHQEMRALRAPLQRCGALVATSVIVPAATGDGHLHRAELARWDQRFPRSLGGPTDIVALLGTALRAAVLAPEKDLARWFSWRWLLPTDAADQLLGRGFAIRPGHGWLAAPART